MGSKKKAKKKIKSINAKAKAAFKKKKGKGTNKYKSVLPAGVKVAAPEHEDNYESDASFLPDDEVDTNDEDSE